MWGRKNKEEEVAGAHGPPSASTTHGDIFDGGNFDNNLTKEVAFATLLAASVHVDGKVKQVEIEEMKALASRTRTLRGIDEIKRSAAFKNAIEAVKTPTQLWDSVGVACDKLVNLEAKNPEDQGICRAVYAHACDIIFADQKVVKEEMKLLKFMQGRMNLDETEAQDIIDGLKLKNLC